MTFWKELCIFLKYNTLSDQQYSSVSRQVYSYIKGLNGVTWSELDYDSQELLLEYDDITDYKGLIPKDHQLTHIPMGFP